MNSNKLPKPVRVTVTHQSEKIFERVFLQYPIVFGRNPSSQIPLEFDFISRTHGMLTDENGKWVIEDLQSSNGIFQNGKRVQRVMLGESAKITVGKLEIHFEFLPELSAVAKKDKAPSPSPDQTAVTMIADAKSLAAMKAVTNKTIDSEKQERFKPSPSPMLAPIPSAPIRPVKKTNTAATQAANVAVAKQAPVAQKKGTSSEPTPSPARSHEGHGGIVPSAVPEFCTVHPELLKGHKKQKVVEATVTWHDQVYDVHQFNATEKVSVGPGKDAVLSCPILRDTLTMATVGTESTVCFIPQNHQITLRRGATETIPMGDLIAKKVLQQNDFGWALKLDFTEVASVNMGSGVQLHLRYIPAPKEMFPNPFWYLEKAMRIAVRTSSVVHLVLLVMLFLSPRPVSPIKLKNVPDRFARLLAEPPKAKPTPTPAPKKEEPKIAKPQHKPKEPPKKIAHQKPPPHPVKPPKTIAKVNKWPMTVKNPVKTAPPPVKVEALGALAALGAISHNVQPNVVTNININKNAGGLQTKVNTGGIVGALPSTNGMLVAGGGSVKTKGGKGFGTGQGYGMQGLKGSAGARGVAGAVVGEPKLATAAKLEGLTRAQIMAVVKKYAGEIQSCYEKSLLQEPALRGRMEFEWEISPAGTVTTARVKRSQVQNGDSLGECVKGVFGSMKFPRATNGQWTMPNIGFPFGTM